MKKYTKMLRFSLKYIFFFMLFLFSICSIMIIHYLDNHKAKHSLKTTVINGNSNLHGG